MKHQILVIDDDRSMFDMIQLVWERYGAALTQAFTIQEALLALPHKQYSLIVILSRHQLNDLLALLSDLREKSDIPILVLAKHYCSHDKMIAICHGADEYQPIPEHIEESAASGISLIRRHENNTYQSEKPFVCGNLKLYKHRRKIYLNDIYVPFSNSEYEIMQLMIGKIGYTFSPEQIYSHINVNVVVTVDVRNAIWSHIKRIRKKINSISHNAGIIIENVRGHGYRIDKEE